MKASEAPKNIYLFKNPITEIPDDRWLSKKSSDEDIEYVRKDAFIEKLFKWLEENVERHISADGEYTVYYEEMFEDFKKAMKL